MQKTMFPLLDRIFRFNRLAIALLALALFAVGVDTSFGQTSDAKSSESDGQTASDGAPATPNHGHPYAVQLKHGVDHDNGNGHAILNFSAPAGSHLTYYGGPVVTNIQVVVVNYGTGSYLPALATNLPGFFTAITNGTFMDMLSEYYTVGRGGTNQQIQHGTYIGTYNISPSAANNGSTIDDTQIQAELIAQINAGHLPAPTYDAGGNANTWYMIYFPAGKTITQGGSSSCVSGGFCAYHGTTTLNSRDVLYGVQPDMQAGSGCSTGCGGSATPFNNYSSVASHEFAETITDAAVGLATTLSPPLAWYDNTNGEIGDICNAQQGTADGYTVQAEFSNLQGNCVLGPVSLAVSAPTSSTPGTAFNVTVTAKNSTGANTGSGYTGTIHFTSTDNTAALPADYTFTSANAGTQTFSVTLNAAGTQTISVEDTLANGFKGSANVSISGTASDFSIAASPTSLSIQQGNSGTSTISTAVTAGSAGTVSLSVSGVPSGASASLSPTSVTAGGSSTLTVNAGTAATGTYTLTVTGTEGSATHSATVSVTITASTTPDFTISANPSALSILQGNSGTSTISTTQITAAGTVSLAVSGVPSGATATLSPTSVAAGSSSTLTINTGSAAPGTYTLTVTGTEGSKTHSATVGLTITTPPPPNGIVNGGFETGNLTGWTSSGASTSVVTGGHSGTYAARLGSTSPTNGDSTITQAFTAPTGSTGISFWYKMSCPDTVTYDWATASLKDNTAGTTATLLPKVCQTNSSWVNVTGSLTAGHSYTLTLTSHDDNYTGDPTYTLYDDVTTTSTPPPPSGITNGGFETGSLSGWTASGASETVVTGGHSGTYAARLGSTSPTNGDSSITQSFTAPSGTTHLSFWYKMTCPDTVTYDWATVTLKNLSTGTTTTVLPKTCATNSTWVNVSATITAGTSYTLTLTSHDDNYGADPSYTLYDDVTTQ